MNIHMNLTLSTALDAVCATALFPTAAVASAPGAIALSGAAAGVGIMTLALCRRRGPRRASREHRGRNERGEGVISAAIAVLIIASLGALMWVGFKALWENAEETTNSEIAKIGK